MEARSKEAPHATVVVLVGRHGCGALDRQWGDARVCNETAAGGREGQQVCPYCPTGGSKESMCADAPGVARGCTGAEGEDPSLGSTGKGPGVARGCAGAEGEGEGALQLRTWGGVGGYHPDRKREAAVGGVGITLVAPYDPLLCDKRKRRATCEGGCLTSCPRITTSASEVVAADVAAALACEAFWEVLQMR